jgi:hypothetical protein
VPPGRWRECCYLAAEMSRNYIDFISAYCDSWCERCVFTQRCSHFAVMSALAMCDGDYEVAMELAIGPARVPGGKPQKHLDERIAEVMNGYEEPTEKELEEIGCEIDDRRERMSRHPLAESSYDYVVAGRRWLEKHEGVDSADSAIRPEIEAIRWDLFLIHVKIMRALNGRDEDPKGRFWKSRVQNDWNGSAKVALISIERTERAWRSIAAGTADEGAGALADALGRLHQDMLREFPRAMDFRRPGFDDAESRPGSRS